MEYINHSSSDRLARTRLRFGPWEVDRASGEVRKFGTRIKLTGQPLEVLLLLLERAGELVTREEIQQRLWPQDVFVDFERSLNSAVKKLRRTLNDNPDDPRYIETHPRKGYRFIAAVEQVVSGADEGAGTAPAPAEIAAASPGVPAASGIPYLKWMIVAGAVLAFVLVGIGLRVRAQREARTATVANPKRPNVRGSIAILGFKNLSSQREQDWLGTAFTQMLSTELQAGGTLRVVPEEVVTRAKQDLDLKEKDGYPRSALRALHENLATDYVVAGSYVALGDKATGQVRLDVRLQETISGETLASIAVSGKQAEIFDLVSRAGQEMRTKVGGTIGPEGDVDWRAVYPANPDAARLYAAGLERLRVADNVSASELLRQSLTIDPQFALGHAALAEAWEALGYDGRAQAAAQKALSLSSALPENVRLKIEGRYYELQHDYAGAVAAYRHLTQDYPDDIEAGLRLAETQALAGQLNDAATTISRLRSLPVSYREDPRIDLVEASLAARNSDYKAQQALAQAAAKKAEASGARLLLARARLIEGWALDDQGQLDDALKAYRDAQRIFEAAGEMDSTATVLNDIGIVQQKQGNLGAALSTLQDARKRFQEVGNENGSASTLTNLGEVYRARGEFAAAEDLYREALEIFRKGGRKENEYSALNNLGSLLYERGEFREARKIFEDLLRARQAAGDKSGAAFAKTNLADTLRVEGDLLRSLDLQEESLNTFREIGDRVSEAQARAGYASALILNGQLAEARKSLEAALKTNQEIGARGDAAFDQVLLAKVTLYEGHPEKIDLDTLRAAVDELGAEHRGADQVEGISIETEALVAAGKFEEARRAVARGQSIRNTNWLARFHLTLAAAQLDAAEGKRESARRHLAVAQAMAGKAGCRTCETELRPRQARL